jgi:hypothetical protein
MARRDPKQALDRLMTMLDNTSMIPTCSERSHRYHEDSDRGIRSPYQ